MYIITDSQLQKSQEFRLLILFNYKKNDYQFQKKNDYPIYTWTLIIVTHSGVKFLNQLLVLMKTGRITVHGSHLVTSYHVLNSGGWSHMIYIHVNSYQYVSPFTFFFIPKYASGIDMEIKYICKSHKVLAESTHVCVTRA